MEELGKFVDDSAGAILKPPGELRNIAKSWFQERKSDFQEFICSNPKLSKLRDKGDLVAIILEISDLIKIPFDEFEILIVAALIMKYGLEEFCKGYQPK